MEDIVQNNYDLHFFGPGELSEKIILSFLKNIDNDFIPALSSRVNLFTYSKKLNLNARHLCFFDKNSLIGIASFYFNRYPDDSYWTFFAVDKNYRKLGIGIQLEEALINYCIINETKAIRGEARADNKRLIAMHKSFGFIVLGIKKNTNDTEEKVDLYLNIKK